MESAVEGIRPRRVLDLGTNRGEHSLLAASRATSVVAVDADAAAVDELYRIERRQA
ncbi:MAG: hypothetical protein ACRDGE_02190 [Candidatus Limnocylindria bacterium]